MRDVNKQKRLEWCKDRLRENDQFDNVIFTDKCSVQLDRHGRVCFRKENEPRKLTIVLPQEKWKTHNIRGKRGKQAIDTSIINYVKERTFEAFPKNVGEDVTKSWATCIRAMDAGGRSLVFKQKEKEGP